MQILKESKKLMSQKPLDMSCESFAFSCDSLEEFLRGLLPTSGHTSGHIPTNRFFLDVQQIKADVQTEFNSNVAQEDFCLHVSQSHFLGQLVKRQICSYYDQKGYISEDMGCSSISMRHRSDSSSRLLATFSINNQEAIGHSFPAVGTLMVTVRELDF